MRLFRCLLMIAASLAVANPLTLPSSQTVGEEGRVRGEKKRQLLVIGQGKGYQHDSISTAMVTLYNLGRSSKHWDTFFRTDCAAVTKKPLKWGAKNLDAFDAVVFFTDGDLDMDDSQKADLLSFVREDGKGFIGIHSAAITFTSWPEYGKMLGGYFDYNGLGHREEVWERPDIQKMWMDMVRWSMGDLPGNATPRPASAR